MGRAERKRPERLGEKLLFIRRKLNLTQSELVSKLSSEDYVIYKGDVSKYELGKSEPPLVILLRYSRLGSVSIETIVDDDLDFPE